MNNIFDIYFNENYHDNDINNAYYYYYAETATDENENKKKPERGANRPVTNTQTEAQTQHPTAPVIDIIDKMVASGKGSRGFDNSDCIFNGSMDRTGITISDVIHSRINQFYLHNSNNNRQFKHITGNFIK